MYSSVISRNAGIDHMTFNKVISGCDLIIHNLVFNYSYVIFIWDHLDIISVICVTDLLS